MNLPRSLGHETIDFSVGNNWRTLMDAEVILPFHRRFGQMLLSGTASVTTADGFSASLRRRLPLEHLGQRRPWTQVLGDDLSQQPAEAYQHALLVDRQHFDSYTRRKTHLNNHNKVDHSMTTRRESTGNSLALWRRRRPTDRVD